MNCDEEEGIVCFRKWRQTEGPQQEMATNYAVSAHYAVSRPTEPNRLVLVTKYYQQPPSFIYNLFTLNAKSNTKGHETPSCLQAKLSHEVVLRFICCEPNVKTCLDGWGTSIM